MTSKRKAEAIGRVLILSSEIDSKRGENKKLQNILGEELYNQIGNKWFYDINNLNKLTIQKLNKLADKIEEALRQIGINLK